MTDKQYIDIAYDVHIRRIFLRMGLVDNDNQNNILEAARKINPGFPGELTTPFWSIGRNFCHATNPECIRCPFNNCCGEYNKANEKQPV